MLKRLAILSALVGAVVATAAAPAQAASITGSISFSGSAQPLTGSNWGNTTGVDFGTDASVTFALLPSGTYTGTQGMAVSFTDFCSARSPPRSSDVHERRDHLLVHPVIAVDDYAGRE